ncbi:C4-dicarboxylate ABC transporter [Thalassospira lucentensis]|uniref:C4-dicarboxylate ABC transporter n=2 Tax=Thalassospira TaxID=168934 RepID=A0A154L0M1_9PROT|nr:MULTISPECIES: TRAP transporter permease [Thalassospira]KZB61013.1 C4-dicarboxylate ABC transporter [Thalassospira lucentensis]MCH2276206.1 TRAP transporter permease [Thalassospira sp.]WOI11544.1 TRAP transporter permease [Thalassospira lucentensis]SOC28321.1 TRAP transporter, 4TM/12TM fusion protein [Thalassospira xiamenensis]
MTDDKSATQGPSDQDLQDLIAENDTGARQPTGMTARILLYVAVAWSLFQLWLASPLPYIFSFGVFNSTEARSIHLAFAVFLAFLAYPAFKNSPRSYIPVLDWVLAAAGAFCALYIYIFYRELSSRPGLPITQDLVVAGAGLVLLLEATRRALGPPLMIVAMVFLAYVFFGNAPWVPDVLQWAGASFSKAMSHQWITTEGVFGIALGVSTSFVFLFVLFGSLLDKAGAGNYFIKVAFAALGHMRGGPAKAAVLASAMTGLISGSSIANVVTTGTFTIPLMKRVGFSGEKAGAVEVASSVNGQIMPPVMGAAAFLMVEYVGIPYPEVIKHAFLPATISYIALIYIVHLEALKANMKGLPKRQTSTVQQVLIRSLLFVLSLVILAGVIYYAINFQKQIFGNAVGWVVAVECAAIYFAGLYYAAKYPDLELDDPNKPVLELPALGETAKSGLHYLLPVVVLVWFLMIELKSPGLSAFWATVLMLFIMLTQRPVKAFFRKQPDYMASVKEGIADVIDGFATGARNMIGIGVATAAAGIIVGTVSLTGIGQVMVEFVELISGGNLMLILIFTAIISLILGMGLPTTANYIVVSSLMAPVIVELGAANGLIVPLIAVHLFVFYFGIMADVTPPVGLASFAAAAVSGADPMKTGFVAFFYSMRTAALPFLFLFNTQLLMIGLDHPLDVVMVIVVSTIAMLVFAAGTMGYFFTRSKLWESAALLLIAFTLFRPGFWLDLLEPPYENLPATEIVEKAADMPANTSILLDVEGINLEGDEVTKSVMLPLGPEASGEDRLYNAGIAVRTEDGKVFIDDLVFGGPAEKAGLDFDFEITAIKIEADRMPKEVFFIPAFIVLGGIIVLQRRRRRAEAA